MNRHQKLYLRVRFAIFEGAQHHELHLVARRSLDHPRNGHVGRARIGEIAAPVEQGADEAPVGGDTRSLAPELLHAGEEIEEVGDLDLRFDARDAQPQS